MVASATHLRKLDLIQQGAEKMCQVTFHHCHLAGKPVLSACYVNY